MTHLAPRPGSLMFHRRSRLLDQIPRWSLLIPPWVLIPPGTPAPPYPPGTPAPPWVLLPPWTLAPPGVLIPPGLLAPPYPPGLLAPIEIPRWNLFPRYPLIPR